MEPSSPTGAWVARGGPLRSGGRALAALAASGLALLASCQLDDLLDPGEGARLALSAASVTDSAAAGSRAHRSAAIEITSPSGRHLSWTAAVVGRSPWLSLGAASGTAPATLTLTLDPAGLPQGIVQDTVAIGVAGSEGRPVLLPVRFALTPCGTAEITPGAALADALSESDCGAPHHEGRFARVYRFAGEAGDSITAVLRSASLQGVLVLDTSLAGGALPLARADSCDGSSGAACLVNALLPISGAYYLEATTAGAGETGAFTLSLASPRVPDPPAGLRQLRTDGVSAIPPNGPVGESTVVLRAVLGDPDAFDLLRLEVELRPEGTAFTGAPLAASAWAANGDSAVVVISGLDDDTGYRWQARTADVTGRQSAWVTFREEAEGGPDFRVDVPDAPAPPASLGQFAPRDGAPIPTGGVAQEAVIDLRASVSDPDGDRVRLEVELRRLDEPLRADPTGSSIEVGSGGEATVTAGPLQDGAAYHWQARTVDRNGTAGAWVAFGDNAESDADFQVMLAGVPVPPSTLEQLRSDGSEAIAVGGTVDEAVVLLRATVAHTDPEALVRLELEVRRVGTGFTTPTAQSDPVSGGTSVAIAVADLSDDTGYHWRVRTTNAAGAAASEWVAFGDNRDPEDADFTVRVPAVALSFTVQPTAAAVGGVIRPPVEVMASEASGAVDTAFAGTVTLSITPGTGTSGAVLGGAVSRAASRGVATFADLTIDRVGEGYALDAAADGLPVTTSAMFDVTDRPPAELRFTVQPADARVGSVLTPAVQVSVFDADGNPAGGFTGTVTIALGENPGGATLSGTLAVSAAGGVADFSDLSLDRAGDGYTLRASAEEIGEAESEPFGVAPAPATQLSFTVQPSNASRNRTITPPVEVTAVDPFGNRDTSYTGEVTLALTPGTGTAGASLSGATTVTAVAGVATFRDLTVDETGTGYTLDATADGLPDATSEPFDVTAGPAVELRFTVQPAAVEAGAAIAPAVVVTAFDAEGNVASTFGGTVTVALAENPARGTLGGTPAVTAVEGVATFADLWVDRAGDGYTLSASAPDLSQATSDAFSVLPGPATRLAFTVQPSSATEDEVIVPAVVVTAFDAQGNVATGFTGEVSVELDGARGARLGGTLAVAAAAGVATFADLSVDRDRDGLTLIAQAAGLPSVESEPFDVVDD